MNNKTLAIAFAALVVIYLATKFIGGNRERSFDPQILAVDTSSVTRLVIDPANDDVSFTLERTGGGWSLTKDGQQFSATTGGVSSLLSNLLNVKADRVVSKNPARWKDYSVDDTTGTRIEIYNGANKMNDVTIGRFNFNQATRSGISYIKLREKDDVYSVDGFLSMSLSQGADNYRNKVLTSLNADDIIRITLQEGAGQRSYNRIANQWQDESGNSIDSAKMVTYINNIKSVSGGSFLGDTSSQMGGKLNTMLIEGNNMSGPVEINLFESRDTTNHFVLHSSSNAEGYFFSDSSGIYSRLFGSFDDPRKAE